MQLLKSLPRSFGFLLKLIKAQNKTFYAYIFVYIEEIEQLFDLKVYALYLLEAFNGGFHTIDFDPEMSIYK